MSDPTENKREPTVHFPSSGRLSSESTKKVPPIRNAANYRLPEDMQEAASAPVNAAASEPGSENPAPKKRKRSSLARRRSVQRGCLTSLIYTAIVLGVSMTLSAFIILFVNEVFAFVKPDITATIEIVETDNFSSVSQKLAEADIIKYPALFNIYLKVAKSDITFTPGEFEINSKLDYPAITRALRKGVGTRDTVRVTIPEGYTTVQIVNLLSTKNVCPAQDLYDAIANDDFDYDWMGETGEGYQRLEGFLFPDTYEFYEDDDPHNVINKFLSAFDTHYDEDLRADAKVSGYSLRQLITIASMVEREAYLDEERPAISAVIFNRLKSTRYPYLQVDATLAYILGRAPTDDELTSVNNLYNTYLYKGLPPTPISNPGQESIFAALYPETCDYYYYVARSDGSHIFSRTDEEHAAAVKEVSEE